MRKVIEFIAVVWCLASRTAGFAQTNVCYDEGNCKTFPSQQDADRYIKDHAKATEARARGIIRHMPIDYRDCILPALLDEMLPLRMENLYVAGMDKTLEAKLAQHGVSALPESAFPKKIRELQSYTPHTSYWQFSFGFLATLEPNEEYEFFIGSHCGTLCLSRTRYVLRRVGTTCSIVSKKWEGGA
jgi:hypothetical protein